MPRPHWQGGKKIEEKEYKVWISLIDNLGIERYKKLIQKFDSKEQLWEAKKEQLQKIEGIGEKISETISSKEIKQDVKRHLKYMEEHNIDIISIEDKHIHYLMITLHSYKINKFSKKLREWKEASKNN